MAIQFARHNTLSLVWVIYGAAVFLCGFETEYIAKPHDPMIEADEYEAFWTLDVTNQQLKMFLSLQSTTTSDYFEIFLMIYWNSLT